MSEQHPSEQGSSEQGPAGHASEEPGPAASVARGEPSRDEHRSPEQRPPGLHRGGADGWVTLPDGGKRWGLLGAAGLLILDPERGVLLQHRVSWSAHGGTWGIPGGALDHGEDALTGALRESHEEAGIPELDGSGVRVIGRHILDLGVWSYTTILALTTTRLQERLGDAESVELRWVPMLEVADYPLHPSFGDAWPEHRARLMGALHD